MKRAFLIGTILLMSACVPIQTTEPPLPSPTEPASPPTDISSPPTDSANASADPFVLLPAPACDGRLTPSQMEGPYYTPNTPERNSLLEVGMAGEKLVDGVRERRLYYNPRHDDKMLSTHSRRKDIARYSSVHT